jgi:hypothetical protein
MHVQPRVVTVLAVVAFASMASSAQAAPFSLDMHVGGFYADTGLSVAKNLLVNGVATALPSGLSFQINLDDTTPDTEAHVSLGNFLAASITLTSTDLGVTDMLVTGPSLFYSETDFGFFGFGRTGFTDGSSLGCCGILISPSSAPAVGVGDPNVLDTLPDMFGTGVGAVWMTGFTLTLQNGTTIAADGPADSLTYIGQSSISGAEDTAPVPEPASIALVGLGAVVVAARVRRRNQRR